jgi:outer membrane protein
MMKYIDMKFAKIFILSFLFFFGLAGTFAQVVLTLEESLEVAFKNSPDIQRSRLNMLQNKELLNAQLAGLKSRFGLEVTPLSYNKEDAYDEFTSLWYTSETKRSSGDFSISQPIKLLDGTLSLINSFEYQDNYTKNDISSNSNSGFNNYFYLRYDQPLFTYNRTKMNLEKNQLNLENATLAYSIEMLNMEKYVAEAFYAIYQKKLAIQVAQEDFDNQKISKEIIESKVEGQLSAKEELFQAELNYTTSFSNLEDKKVDLENAKDQFKRLIGVSLDEDIDVLTDIQYKEVQVNLDFAVSNGLKQRLEIQQKEISITNAKFSLIETSAINEFKGDISLSMGLMGNDEYFGKIYDKPTKSPQMGITFSIPIYDWGKRKAQIKAAELALESTKIDLEDLESDIIINIRQVYRNLKNWVRQIGIADQNVKNAELTYEINLERYRNGDLTGMDLELFQNQLSEKKMAKANALINYKLELLNMKIQSLWDFENNTSFVPQDLQNNLQK